MLTFAVGGDDRQTDPKEWRGTLTGPDTWRVIEYRAKKVGKDAAGKMIPVYESLLDRLPDDLLKRAGKIWDAGRDKAWNPSHAKAVNRLPDPVAHAVPLFWTAQGVPPVTMLSMSKAAPPVLQAANGATGVYVPRPPRVIPVEHQPHLLWEDEPPIPAQRVPVVAKEPPTAGRTTGTWWQHCDPAPLRLDASRATDVGASRALWRFEYTGDITHEGHPLYWIVTGDEAWLLAGFDDKGNHALWANLLHAAGRDRQLPGSSPAAWAVFPADPSGLHAGRLDGCYLLWNPVLKAFLGPEGKLSGRRGWYEPAHEERHFDTSPGAPGFEHWRPELVQIHVPQRDCDEPDIGIARTLLKPFGEGASGRVADALSALYADKSLEDFCWELKPYTG